MESREHGPTELAGRSELHTDSGRSEAAGAASAAMQAHGKVPAAGRSSAHRQRRSSRLRGAVVRKWSQPPWRKLPKQAKNKFTLNAWRKWAFDAARAKGGRRACGLCKRAMMGCAAIEIRPPWSTSQTKLRSLCSGCWREITTWLDDQEYARDAYSEPIDWVSRLKRSEYE